MAFNGLAETINRRHLERKERKERKEMKGNEIRNERRATYPPTESDPSIFYYK